ncbi:hypothetical protein ACYSNO_09000 [Enterococcus sp. LJL98]
MTTLKKHLLMLNFTPFVLVNGMNLFPMFIFSQLFLSHSRNVRYLMPLILYYCFKTNSLFLTRLKPVQMNRLLTLSIRLGVIGCFLGMLTSYHLLFGWLAGAFLGGCSGRLFGNLVTELYDHSIS